MLLHGLFPYKVDLMENTLPIIHKDYSFPPPARARNKLQSSLLAPAGIPGGKTLEGNGGFPPKCVFPQEFLPHANLYLCPRN